MKLDNVFMLRDVVKLGGEQIKGRKKMQKIIYILQQLVNPFEPPFKFKWNYYGVYSDELAGELGIGEFFGILKEKPIMEYGYQTYAIVAVDDSNPTRIASNEQVKSLITSLNDKEPRLLEVLSSILYFENEGLTEDKINDQLLAYKGHLKEFFDEAYNVYKEIKGMDVRPAGK